MNIPIMQGSVRIGEDSWLWAFSGVVPSRAAAKLVDPNEIGEPVEVLLTVDGYEWKFLIEEITESYTYGEGSYSIEGRSVAAELDEPYAPKVTKTFDSLTSSQTIVSNELTDTGWSITWDILDWNIPADVFSVTNATIAKILAEVAKAVGAVFRAHPSDKDLEFVYKFQTDPADWEIDDPDEILTTGTILSQSMKFEASPEYNYVIVSGTKDGVVVHVKRTDTPADIPAPVVTDPLITTVNAGRERGRNILDAEGYNKIVATISLPLPHAESEDRPMLLLPGHIVQVDDLFANNYRGKVVNTTVSFGGSSVTMTVDVERYLTS